MKITRIAAYQFRFPITEKEKAALSGGRAYTSAVSTVVEISTDCGETGWGESVPWGAIYLPAYAGGIIPGLHEIAPALLGHNPLEIGCINAIMDATLMGHPYIKTAVDMACWDLLGKATGMPCCDLLGGRLTQSVSIGAFLPRTINEEIYDEMDRHRQNGESHFVTKASGRPEKDIRYIRFVAEKLQPGESLVLDVNCGYRMDEALRVVQQTRGADIGLEQPCATIEECMEVGQRTGIPIMLDECLQSVDDFVRASSIGRIDAVNLKIGRIGGISKTRVLRDLCAAMNIPIFMQDTGLTNIAAAGVAHLAHSTPERILEYAWQGTGMIGVQTATGAPPVVGNHFQASDAPGLGITPIPEVLGQPLASWE